MKNEVRESEQTSKNALRDAVLVIFLGLIALLIIAFVWHYSTAKPPESDLHTRPAATSFVRLKVAFYSIVR